jgi:hypothetical protein
MVNVSREELVDIINYNFGQDVICCRKCNRKLHVIET